MISKIIFLLLIASASNDKTSSTAQICPLALRDRKMLSPKLLIFKFLEFIDLYYFVFTSKEVLRLLPVFLTIAGLGKEARTFFASQIFGGKCPGRQCFDVSPLRVPLFLKMKIVPKEKLSLRIIRQGSKIKGFEISDNSLFIRMDKTFFNIEIPGNVRVAFSFDFGKERFFLDEISLPTPFLHGKQIGEWKELVFQVYFKYSSGRYEACLIYPSQRGLVPFVIDGEKNILFLSTDLNICQTSKLISSIPNINSIIYLEEINSNFIGVSYNAKQQTWIAKRRSKIEKKTLRNGSYIDPIQAAHASDTLAKELMRNGEVDLKLNFPHDDIEVYSEEKIKRKRHENYSKNI